MLHCAEEIATYLQDYLAATAETNGSSIATLTATDDPHISQWLRASLDAAQTIVNCVTHQRSIVDDVLTLSKLDSNLLSLCPVVVEPTKVVLEAMKLFEGEMRRASMSGLSPTLLLSKISIPIGFFSILEEYTRSSCNYNLLWACWMLMLS